MTALAVQGCTTVHRGLMSWVDEVAALTEPDDVIWIDGSDQQRQQLIEMLTYSGDLQPLSGRFSGSYAAYSDPRDVARVIKDTHICSIEDSGPLTNWWDPAEAMPAMQGKLYGSMHGRTMYVQPCSMGPIGSPLARIMVQVTDSPYVVLNTLIMARCGEAVLAQLGSDGEFVKAIHTVGVPLEPGVEDVPWPCNPEGLKVTHFPDHGLIISYGSGYGGNALLGKKCMALRLGSALAAKDPEGAMAEHMMIIRVTEDATGRQWHIAAAFPSACGKTNFAMLQPTIPGYTVTTVGDDICWMRVGDDGRLRAINPEAGFFGVAPGTSARTNPVAVEAILRGSLVTNVAYDPVTGEAWWPRLSEPPSVLITWKGEIWHGDSGVPVETTVHPNARFTTPYASCESGDVDIWNSSEGVPIDVILFGGRRPDTVPLVRLARDWTEGVLFGSMVSSARTAAAEGKVGEMTHDPFAMAPFFGLKVTDYVRNWLRMGELIDGHKLPIVGYVNWFRRGADDRILWPGFGDNIRVIDWIIRAIRGDVPVYDTAIGFTPRWPDINTDGLDITPGDLDDLTCVDVNAWADELREVREYLVGTFGDEFPHELIDRIDQALEQLEPVYV